ncbi:MAG: hypothetical protein E6J21_09125 [Chloroflexota bacterium]|nr:MAG: hypothetical protein E6J21_09125 [Chloroflexota bacterium]
MDSTSAQSIHKQLPLTSVLQPEDTDGPTLNDDSSLPTSAVSASLLPETSLKGWYIAFKNILPTYFTIHLLFFIITCLSVLFSIKDFSSQHLNISTLWQSWLHWDTYNYIAVAVNGYSVSWLTAFYPLYPLLVRCLMFLVHDPLIAGLIVSNLSGLGMLAVLYRVVQEDFDDEVASRTVLYFSIFPTAFFFAAVYSESLFLFLTLLSFYQMRHSRWCDIASGLCIIAGIGLFALYCYYLFHDPLAFSHAEARWDRKLSVPGYAVLRTVHAIIISQGVLSFQSLRNILDLIPDLFMVVLVILGFVGPWKFRRDLWVYAIFAAAFFVFPQLFPFAGLYPLQAMARFLLPIFPAFIVLAAIGKNRTLDVGYLLISGSVLFFLLTQFLTGHWVI